MKRLMFFLALSGILTTACGSPPTSLAGGRLPKRQPMSYGPPVALHGVAAQEQYLMAWQPAIVRQIWKEVHKPPIYLSSPGSFLVHHHWVHRREFYFWAPVNAVPASAPIGAIVGHQVDVVLPVMPPTWPGGWSHPVPVHAGLVTLRRLPIRDNGTPLSNRTYTDETWLMNHEPAWVRQTWTQYGCPPVYYAGTYYFEPPGDPKTDVVDAITVPPIQNLPQPWPTWLDGPIPSTPHYHGGCL
ncbi:hypothetical protein Sulac_1695 [Sulfobacillus acidophilus DSM 10332]|uniref:Uncharacterized protein n=1 Tax=Sulfobacillus acidophilus (strain ATCC 700253 / DSM 10332 / NAL) TaxID=679936 RepID=G8TZ12_SULAD|nr:hypothetical protein Sulac_1695 [Sulfobacillus acidophilus DSM 10332]